MEWVGCLVLALAGVAFMIVPCSTALTIRPSATTRITVTFVSLAVACSLTTA